MLGRRVFWSPESGGGQIRRLCHRVYGLCGGAGRLDLGRGSRSLVM